jgi:hypothetical protein
MNSKFIFHLVLVLLFPCRILIGREPPATQSSSPKIHSWEYITYPMIALPDEKTNLSFIVGYGEKAQGLRLDIQIGWRLSLIQSNPFDAQSEVVLYRDDGKVPGPLYLWELHAPRTEVLVVEADEQVIHGHCEDIRLHDDGVRRSDTFNLGRNGTSDGVRSWGQLAIRVDDRVYRIIVPSSLYKCIHGHASRD